VQAARVSRRGANAFSRYENGKSRPPVALVQLRIMLDHHPELLNEVRLAR
jgi:HTH-type transcriptional regulator/antitoxin MqsA